MIFPLEICLSFIQPNLKIHLISLADPEISLKNTLIAYKSLTKILFTK